MKRLKIFKKENFIFPTQLRNFLIDDPILDYFKYQKHNYPKDSNENHQVEIMQRGIDYENYIVSKLNVINVQDKYSNMDYDSFFYTKELLDKKTEIIYQGFILDENQQIAGYPDLIIRKDIFKNLYNISINSDYAIVDIKHSTLELTKDGMLSNSKRYLPYKSQVYLYSKIFNFEGFIYGRKVIQNKQMLDRNIVKIEFTPELISKTEEAIEWVKKVKNHTLNPKEIHCNMKNHSDYPWRTAKTILAKKTNNLTQYWGINNKMAKEMNGYSNREVRETIGMVQNETKKELMMNIFCTNQGVPRPIEFSLLSDEEYYFVDFEFINSSSLNFEKETINHLYMIGVGWYDKEWKYKCFIPQKLTLEKEKENLIEFINFVKNKKCMHWSNAEPSLFKKLCLIFELENTIEWIDLLKIFKETKFSRKGLKNFGLKNVAKSLYQKGDIKTLWADDIYDGLGANKLIKENLVENFREIKDLDKVIFYNEIDCKVLYEILEYLKDSVKIIK